MRAIVTKRHGGPEVLSIEERPFPALRSGHVLIEVKAFGINQAEIYFRKGAWGEVAEISGIECVGLVREDPSGRLMPGTKVAAIVGGLGRSLPGSYAEFTLAPASNVIAFESDLAWEQLAAIPESYATAWTSLVGILALVAGQTIVIRGAASALGQAAVNIAYYAGARVVGTTRKTERFEFLRSIGAQNVMLESQELSAEVRELYPDGVDAVLDIIGNTTVLDSLAMLKRGGCACVAGFLGAGGPLTLEPIFQIPSGRSLSVFASALVMGTREFPIDEIPFQQIVDHVTTETYKSRPVKVFKFDEIQQAHRLMESGAANGKIVVTVS